MEIYIYIISTYNWDFTPKTDGFFGKILVEFQVLCHTSSLAALRPETSSPMSELSNPTWIPRCDLELGTGLRGYCEASTYSKRSRGLTASNLHTIHIHPCIFAILCRK